MNGDSSVGDTEGRPGRSPQAAADVLAATFTLGRALAAPLHVPGPDGFGVTEGTESGRATHLATVQYGVPKEAVANLVLRFSYFREELRSLPICLSDYPRSPSATGTRGRRAILSTVGTRVSVGMDGTRPLQRVRVFLDDRLAPYELAPDANGDHGWIVTTDAVAPRTLPERGGGEVATVGRR